MPANKESYQRSRHAVHAVKYHFVWCPKRRAKVLKNEIANRLEQVLFDVADEHDWEIGSLAIRPDHVHLFVQADTRHAPYQVIHRFKEKALTFCEKSSTSFTGFRRFGPARIS